MVIAEEFAGKLNLDCSTKVRKLAKRVGKLARAKLYNVLEFLELRMLKDFVNMYILSSP